jgi:methylmalonyl-CoA decarboxylase
MTLILQEHRDDIATITLNHQDKRNALSSALIDEVITALRTFVAASARAVVLRAATGVKVWSAGHDVEELPQSKRDPLGWDDPLRRLVREIEDTPMPVIAMIEGSVWGGACEVAMACDIVVACDTSTFAITPAKLGVPYNLTGLMTFMNAVHLHIVKEMAFTAQPIPAQRAEQLGIVNRVVPAAELEATAYGLAAQVSQNAPLSIAVMKEELNLLANARDLSPQTFERIQALRRVVYNSDDYREGIQAFLEKRKPTFRGR